MSKAGFPVMAENTHRQIFTTEVLIRILAANTCMIDFFCESTAASNFCNDRKSALGLVVCHKDKVMLRDRLYQKNNSVFLPHCKNRAWCHKCFITS